MASSSTFAVVLVFMALGGVLAAEAAGRPSGTLGWNANGINTEDMSGLQRLSIPTWLMASDSPLDADRTSKYLDQVNDKTLGQHGKEFCQEAKLQCQADIAIVDPTLRISRSSLLDQELFQQTRDLVDASRAMQFERNAINKDSEIVLPQNLHDSYPTVSFLPQSLAEKMPFSSAKMPELLDSLNIAHDSNMAIMMSRTVGQCEAQEQGKDTRKCVTSLEGMKTFVGSSLPQDKRIAALERSSSLPGAGESRSKDSWKVLDAKLYDRAVVCRNSVFPYAVFECHDTSKTNMHIYQVEMQGRDGSRIHEVAACHENNSVHSITNSINGNTDQSGTISRAAEACHWVTDSLIWTPTN
ncbi:hypothetical protein KC19_5G118000 [Ceratodon purpureus]|uniref:BURP domain-containing protein n=1 Tax=Ceratodon purpureus TaxID=3225 RepID=A0A8T0I2Y3_CERPU|nr:hypothetical protein KC19_5G118000 [Ceratodon purpureus]